MKKIKLKEWLVTRVVREEMYVEYAESREDAIRQALNPYVVIVVRETAKRTKTPMPFGHSGGRDKKR